MLLLLGRPGEDEQSAALWGRVNAAGDGGLLGVSILFGGPDHSSGDPHSSAQFGWPDLPAIYHNGCVIRDRETVYGVISKAQYDGVGHNEAHDRSVDLSDVGYGGLLHAFYVDMRYLGAGLEVSWGDGLAIHRDGGICWQAKELQASVRVSEDHRVAGNIDDVGAIDLDVFCDALGCGGCGGGLLGEEDGRSEEEECSHAMG